MLLNPVFEIHAVLCLTAQPAILAAVCALDLGPLQKLYRAGSYYPRPRSALGCAMDADTRNAALALVVVVLACTAIFVGTHATELMGIVPH